MHCLPFLTELADVPFLLVPGKQLACFIRPPVDRPFVHYWFVGVFHVAPATLELCEVYLLLVEVTSSRLSSLEVAARAGCAQSDDFADDLLVIWQRSEYKASEYKTPALGRPSVAG